MAVFKNYYVFPVKDKINKLKSDFISSKDSYDLCAISSMNKDWYIHNSGIYTVKSEDEFEIKTIPDNIMSLYFINEFIRNGLNSKYQLNAVNKSNINYFVLSWLGLSKSDDKYVLEQAALISEHVYNIYMIMARRFLSTTTPDDLSRYKDYFTVFENPGQVINTNNIEKEYNSGLITLDEMNEKISILERENKAILSLRK